MWEKYLLEFTLVIIPLFNSSLIIHMQILQNILDGGNGKKRFILVSILFSTPLWLRSEIP